MPIRNQDWFNLNEGRKYPLDDRASANDDGSRLLPSDILTDISLRYPASLGAYPFLSVVVLSPGLVSVVLSVADALDNPTSVLPLASVAVPRAGFVESRPYFLRAMQDGVGGWITFGSGASRAVTSPVQYRLSSPRQGSLLPKLCRGYPPTPVESLGKLHVAPKLTGLVRLSAENPLEIVGGEISVDGKTHRCALVRLVQPVVNNTEDTVREENVFEAFAGPCGKRPESGNCGYPEPIEYLAGVGPDCDGVITIEFAGCAKIGRIDGECAIVIDCDMGMEDVCLPDHLPNSQGVLPSEFDRLPTTSASASTDPPVESQSEVGVPNGSLPFTACFDTPELLDFEIAHGDWVFVDDENETQPACDTPDVWYHSQSLSIGPAGSVASEGPLSASSRNILVWNGFDTTTLYRRAVAATRLVDGPPGSRHNAGLAVNYQPHPTISGRFVYFVAEIDYETQTFRVRRFNGTGFTTLVSVVIPGLTLGDWYEIAVTTGVATGGGIEITASLDGIDDPFIGATLGPITTNNYLPSSGLFGLHTDRAWSRFAYLRIEENGV